MGQTPHMYPASFLSLGMLVTYFVWTVHRLLSSKRPTRYAFTASYNTMVAEDWNQKLAQPAVAPALKQINGKVSGIPED